MMHENRCRKLDEMTRLVTQAPIACASECSGSLASEAIPWEGMRERSDDCKNARET
jgi:hypothetical protein